MTGQNDAKRADILYFQFQAIRGGFAPYDLQKYKDMTEREQFRVVYSRVIAMGDEEIEERHHGRS